MTSIPKEKSLDSSIALLLDGYRFIQKRCERHHSDIFETRLLGKKALCMRGEEASKIFYTDHFQRKGVVPKRIKKSLFGVGGVQGLDDAAHHHRKEMFMSLMTQERINELIKLTGEIWNKYISQWQKQQNIILYSEVQEILTRAICKWSGVPLKEAEVKKRAKDFGAMVDAFGAIGPRHWKGRWARSRAEKWIEEIVTQIRARKLEVPEDSPAYRITWHRDLEGKLLKVHVAAVEILNILRPTVAIARFITYAAQALYDYPEYRVKLQEGSDKDIEMFVQEVRRFYPFAPFMGAKVREGFSWNGYEFPKGRLVLLDLYSTNRDHKVWDNPDEFRPERFQTWKESPFNFIPQGGGEHFQGHRCAGEWLTIEVMKLAVRALVNWMEYEVPDQNLSISTRRMPAITKSRFVIKHVKRVKQPQAELV